MANEATVTVGDVRPLQGAVVRRATATEALAFGDAVYVDSATGDIPNVSKAIGSAINILDNVYGIAVAGNPGNPGATSIAAADPVDVCVFGPVTGYSGGTPGNVVYLADLKGRLSHVVGTKSCLVGKWETASTVFVNPMQVVIAT